MLVFSCARIYQRLVRFLKMLIFEEQKNGENTTWIILIKAQK